MKYILLVVMIVIGIWVMVYFYQFMVKVSLHIGYPVGDLNDWFKLSIVLFVLQLVYKWVFED